MYVFAKNMSAWHFFFPEKPFKIHVSAINKGPENHLKHFFVATFLSKPGLPASGDSNVSCVLFVTNYS